MLLILVVFDFHLKFLLVDKFLNIGILNAFEEIFKKCLKKVKDVKMANIVSALILFNFIAYLRTIAYYYSAHKIISNRKNL